MQNPELLTIDYEVDFVCEYTVKPLNKGHLREMQNMVFIDKWSLFGGNFALF